MAHHAREEILGRFLERALAQAGIDGNHLSAHDLFGHVAGLVILIARQRPGCDLRGNQPALNLPIEEVGAGVAAPQCAVAIEHYDLRADGQNGSDKLLGSRGKSSFDLQAVIPEVSLWKSSGVSTLAATSGSTTGR